MESQLRDRLFRELKTRNYRSVLDLAATLDEPDEIVRAALAAMVVEGFVGEENGLFFVKYVLDPIRQREHVGEIRYRDILAETAVEQIPERWINPDIDCVVHRDQGGSGCCVGCATAYGRDLDLIKMTGQRPEPEDYARMTRDVTFTERLWYDVYYRQSMSSEYAYRMSRKVGNVTCPSGSYLSASMKALMKHGICLHDQWLAPKSGIEAWQSPYPDYASTVEECADATASKHKIDGYAQVCRWNEVCQAIYRHGYVLGSISVWENFGTQPNDPQLPEPKGPQCGSHALCFVGYDTDKLYFLHSWYGYNPDKSPTWKKVGWISRRYFNMGFLGGYTVLDAEETKIAFAKYANVMIECLTWPDAVLWIDGECKGAAPVTLPLKVGNSYTIGFTSEYYGQFTGTKQKFIVPENAPEIRVTCKPGVTIAMRIHAVTRKVFNMLPRIINLIRNRR